MSTDMYTTRLQPVEVEGNRTVLAASVGAIVVLFLLAVSIAGWTVNIAYQSAHWQEREQIALKQQKELEEKLSQSGSLQAALDYAQTEGFVAGGTVGSLSTTQPVAQNVVIR